VHANANAPTATPPGAYAWHTWPDAPKYDATREGYFNFDATLNVLQDPGLTTYFWAHQFRFIGGDGGYLGLQTNGLMQGSAVGKMAIFSIWQALEAVPGPGAACEQFSGEGTGWSCRLKYNWQAGHRYRLRLWVCCYTAGQEWWGAWVKDMSTGVEHFIGRIRVPLTWKWLEDRSVMWTEFYGPLAQCDDLPLAVARFESITAENGLVRPKSTSVDYGSNADSCRNSRVTIDRGTVTLATGRGVQRFGAGPVGQPDLILRTGRRAMIHAQFPASEKNKPVVFQIISGPDAGLSSRADGYCLSSFGWFNLPTPFACNSDNDGRVIWAFEQKQPKLGDDVIRAFVDSNRNGTWDSTNEAAILVKARWFPPVAYAALGDSYSSGEGVREFFESGNDCHRSVKAYSQLLKVPGYTVPLAQEAQAEVRFFACSGARAYHVARNPNNVLNLSDDEKGKAHGSGPSGDNEPLQVVSVEQANTDGRAIDMVTISIGGNDSMWTEVVTDCFFANDCSTANYTFPHTDIDLDDWIDDRLNLVAQRVAETTRQLKAAAPLAAVFLIGYPQLFPATEPEQTCGKLDPPFAGDNLFRPQEQNYLRGKTVIFDNRLKAVAEQVGVHYVSVLDVFAGHEICGNGGEYISAVTAPDGFELEVGSGTFHPNAKGQAAYARAIADYIDNQLRQGAALTIGGLPQNPSGGTMNAQARASARPDAGGLALTTLSLKPSAINACANKLAVLGGDAAQVSGQGFAPSTSVSLLLEVGGLSPQALPNATTDISGLLTVAVTLPVVASNTLFSVQAFGAAAAGGQQLARSELMPLASQRPLCAVADSATTTRGRAVTVTVVTNDVAGAAALVTASLKPGDPPTYGEVQVRADSGQVVYTPSPDFFGSDAFTYALCDAANNCDSTQVTITVQSDCTLTGTVGNDLLTGTAGPDIICGLDGDDVMRGLGGDDVLIGGAGNDLLMGDEGQDALWGGAGDNVVLASSGDESSGDANALVLLQQRGPSAVFLPILRR
jgi:lysophospholipase L1-like esterase